jgi:hypothetical protein
VSVIVHELHLDATVLFQERRVHLGEVPSVGLRVGGHAGGHELFVRGVDVLSLEAEVSEVDFCVGRAAEFDLQPRCWVNDECEVFGAALDQHAELVGKAIDLLVQVRDGERNVIDP